MKFSSDIVKTLIQNIKDDEARKVKMNKYYKPDEVETLIQNIKDDKAWLKTYTNLVYKMELSWQRMQNLGFVIKTNHKWLNDILVANKDKTLEEIINLVKAQKPDFDIVLSLKSKLEPIFQMEKLPFKFKIGEIVELACFYAKRLYAQWDGDWESINKDEISKKVQEYSVAYFVPKEHHTSYFYSSREYAQKLSKFVCDEIFALCQKQINALFNLNTHKQAIKEQEKRLINALLQKAKMKAMRIIIAKQFNKPFLMVCSHCGFIKYTSIMPNKPQCERCGALMSKKEL